MALLKEKHPNRDFFVVDFADVVPKDDTATMEHPLFSLATKPDMRHLRYENGGISLEIVPGTTGLPTIFDKDVLIFCVSVLMHRMNAGQAIDRSVRFSAREFCVATNRPVGGDHYKRLKAAFSRLMDVRFTTNMPFQGKRKTRMFHLVDEASFVSSGDERDRLEYCEVKLSDWTMDAIHNRALVSINRDYFRLRRPLERRLYELARKHCGSQEKWTIGLEKLQLKTGSNAPLKRFRHNLRQIIADDETPVYKFSLGANDLVTVRPRRTENQITPSIKIPSWADEKAREVARSKGWDFYALQSEFVGFATSKINAGDPPKDIGAAFVGFCKSKERLI
jgi:plasmid replication initiation protein